MGKREGVLEVWASAKAGGLVVSTKAIHLYLGKCEMADDRRFVFRVFIPKPLMLDVISLYLSSIYRRHVYILLNEWMYECGWGDGACAQFDGISSVQVGTAMAITDVDNLIIFL